MKQALEALENLLGAVERNAMCDPVLEYTKEAITSLRQVIAEAEKQEPVAWMSASRFGELQKGVSVITTLTKQRAFEDDVAIHTHPPQRTEPICPECKAEVLYECVACSSNNYPPKENT